MVKPVTPEAHFASCLSPTLMGCALSCKSGFLKYWSRFHFRQPLSSYHIRLSPLLSEEVKMKEDMCV